MFAHTIPYVCCFHDQAGCAPDCAVPGCPLVGCLVASLYGLLLLLCGLSLLLLLLLPLLLSCVCCGRGGLLFQLPDPRPPFEGDHGEFERYSGIMDL